MDKLFTISYFVFLFLLIRVTFLNHSKYRLLIKILTCSHFLGLGIYAALTRDISLMKYLLVIGLILSFIGDVFLGLKDYFKSAFIIGVSAFSLAQLYYLLYLQLYHFNYFAFILALLFMGAFWFYIKRNPKIEFPSKAYFLIVYLFLLSSTFFSSVFYFTEYSSELNFILMIGCILFFLSDLTLFHVYFLKKKNNYLKIAYLVLYHLAQILIASFIYL